MSDKPEEAAKTFQEGFNCAQAVLSTYCESLGMDRKTALRVATGFGGGMGHLGLTCGAVTGAVMAIGLIHGRTDAKDRTPAEKAYTKVQEFMDRFRRANGATSCRDLLGCDISTTEGYAKARREGLFQTVCPKAIRAAAQILGQMFDLT